MTPGDADAYLAGLVDTAADALDTPLPPSYSTIRAVVAEAVQEACKYGASKGKGL